ncbi:MAG: type II toxin-antitoxin system VapC family toxin [Ignisphaera sp.]
MDLDVEEVMRIAIENNITFYDSSYIALAQKLKAPISTEDKDIISVAPRYGVKIIRLHELMDLIKTCG